MIDSDFQEDSQRSLLSDRLVPVFLFLGLLFGVLIIKLFYMQIIDESTAKIKQDTTTYTKKYLSVLSFKI